ncbi:MAG: hypothetical protein UDG94_01150 [Peptococcaceae bacterium]|nr:hypothetical protein [Peptococcaceae bacterium]
MASFQAEKKAPANLPAQYDYYTIKMKYRKNGSPLCPLLKLIRVKGGDAMETIEIIALLALIIQAIGLGLSIERKK